jgi:hypothetical protein
VGAEPIQVDEEHRPARAVVLSLEHFAAASVGLLHPGPELLLCQLVPHLRVQLGVQPSSLVLDVVCSVG